MGTTSCIGNSTKQNLPDKVELIREQIKTIEQHTPQEFLIPCEEEVELEAPTMEALARTNIENHNRYLECYHRHNSWVDWYLDKQRIQQEKP